MTLPPPAAALRLGGRQFPPGQLLVMAVIDDGPGGPGRDIDAAVDAAGAAAAHGADIVAISDPAGDAGQDADRLASLIGRLRVRHPQLLLGVDTWRAGVAAAACAAGADLICDTWAGHDPDLPLAAARFGAGLVCSHTGGLPPQAPPLRPSYGEEPEDVVDEVIGALLGAARRASEAGIPPDSILLDPTLDAGKNTWHGLALLRRLDALATLGHPVLLSLSRMDLVGETLGLPGDDGLEGTLAATSLAAWLGAKVFRAHDVRSTRRALDMISSIRGDRAPARPVRGLA